MTYSELVEAEERNEIVDLAKENWVAWRVLKFLQNRKGFDQGWWARIDADIQDEIFDGLVSLLKQEIRK